MTPVKTEPSSFGFEEDLMSQSVSKPQSRIILRMPEEIYLHIDGQAFAHNRSLNGEVVTSIHKFLYERDALMLMKDRLFATAPGSISDLLKRTPKFSYLASNDRNVHPLTLRLSADVNDDLRSALEIFRKESEPTLSLNSFLLKIMAWWITYNFQVTEFSKSLYRDFKTSTYRSANGSFHLGSFMGHGVACA